MSRAAVRSASGLVVVAVLTFPAEPVQATPCAESYPWDGHYAVPDYFGVGSVAHIGSPDALYKYRRDVDPLSCQYWVVDWLLYPDSANPNYPSYPSTISICFMGDAYYLPSSAINGSTEYSAVGANIPVTQPDCSTFYQYMELWRKRKGESSYSFLGYRARVGIWDAGTKKCTILISSGMSSTQGCYKPPDLSYAIYEFDRFRVYVTQRLRNTQYVRASAWIKGFQFLP